MEGSDLTLDNAFGRIDAKLIKGRTYSDILNEHIPNSEYVVVPGAGHALCLEKPGELNSLLIGFAIKNSL